MADAEADSVRKSVLGAVGVIQLADFAKQQAMIRRGRATARRRGGAISRGRGRPTTVLVRDEVLSSFTDAPAVGSQLLVQLNAQQETAEREGPPSDGGGFDDVLDAQGHLTLHVSPALLEDVVSSTRVSQTAVKLAFELLVPFLRDPKDVRVRYRALSVVDALFLRSKYFRGLVIPRLRSLVDSCSGIESDLPPPADVAALLVERSARILTRWETLHGARHRELALARDYQTSRSRSQGRRFRQSTDLQAQRQQETRAQEDRILRAQFENIRQSVDNVAEELETVLREMTAGFDILIPHAARPHSAGKGEELSDEELDGVSSGHFGHGAGPNSHVLSEVQIKAAISSLEGPENAALFDTLRDLRQQLVRFSDTLRQWYDILLRVNPTPPNSNDPTLTPADREAVLKRVIELREYIKQGEDRCTALGIFPPDDVGSATVIPAAPNTSFVEGDGTVFSVVAVDVEDQAAQHGETSTESILQAEPLNIRADVIDSETKRGKKRKARPRVPAGMTEFVPYFNRDDAETDAPASPQVVSANNPADLRAAAPFVPFFGGLASWGDKEVTVATTTREHRFLGAGSGDSTVDIDKTDTRLLSAVYTRKLKKSKSDVSAAEAAALRRQQLAERSDRGSRAERREKLVRKLSQGGSGPARLDGHI